MPSVLGNINLFVHDVQRSRQFYHTVLNLQENAEQSAPPSRIVFDAGFCTLSLQDGGLHGESGAQPGGIELGFEVDDVDATGARVQPSGGQIVERNNMAWGQAIDARDPDGHRLVIYRRFTG